MSAKFLLPKISRNELSITLSTLWYYHGIMSIIAIYLIFILAQLIWGNKSPSDQSRREPKPAIYFIIIIIKKDWQCKAGRGRLTPYQSEDPSPTLPTNRGKEEKRKIVEDKKGKSN